MKGAFINLNINNRSEKKEIKQEITKEIDHIRFMVIK